MQHDICALADLPEDGLTEREAGGLKILLARDGDTVMATGATCTHKGAPLKNGTRVGNRVICPWHHAVFDLATGAHAEPPGQGCLTRFETTISGGRVNVEIPEGATAHGPEVAVEARKTGGSQVFAILGAGAAGLACAQELVRGGFDGRIVMITQEGEAPYDRTALSKTYLQGKSGDDDLPLVDGGGIAQLGVERIDAAVDHIDVENRVIHFHARDEAPAEGLAYDRCFAAPGSDAATLPLDNADLPNVFGLRTHSDAKALKAAVGDAQDVVIVGSGFIGMEAAAALIQSGKAVTVVSQDPLPFQRQFGEAVAEQITRQHRDKGVVVMTNAKVASLEAVKGTVAHVHLESGDRLKADVVLIAIGARPRTAIFGEGARDGVVVGEDLSLNPSLYVGGDVALFPLAGRDYPARIEHWRVAEQHGRHAARAMLGKAGPFDGVPFFWSAQYGPIHYVGHAKSFDEVHIEGDLDAGSYTAFYVKDGQIVAALGRGKADTTADLHAVMLANRTPDKTELEAAGWQPKALIAG